MKKSGRLGLFPCLLPGLLLSLLILLPGCGFHLRGAQTEAAQARIVYLHEINAGRLYQALQGQLGDALTTTPAAADYELLVSDESLRQNTLSVSAVSGKAEEFNIRYSFFLSIKEAASETALLDKQRLSLTKDYAFDEDAVLSKFEEQRLIENELIGAAAQMAIRRFNAIIGP